MELSDEARHRDVLNVPNRTFKLEMSRDVCMALFFSQLEILVYPVVWIPRIKDTSVSPTINDGVASKAKLLKSTRQTSRISTNRRLGMLQVTYCPTDKVKVIEMV